MADPADLGSEREEIQREESLNRVRYRRQIKPTLDASGKRICRDCDVLIPARRLKANPCAVRCIACQQAHEEQA